MAYAISACKRNSFEAGDLMEVDTTDQAETAGRTATTMALDATESQRQPIRHQPVLQQRPQLQREPFMRQAGPDMSVETAFDRNYSPELARLVMQHGEISFRRRDGSLLALDAAHQGKSAALRILLGRGDSTEHVNALGQTPLVVAAAQGHTETVSALAGYLPNVNHQDHQGNTALMYACQLGNAPLVDSLLQMQPDLSLRNRMNQSAADIARAHHQPAILFKLRAFGMQ